MNVWIWGPPLWDVLHASSDLLDANSASPINLLRPLSVLLPCIYCRNSFAEFYAQLGEPRVGESFQWTYNLHNLVNRKLEKQRIQKYVPNCKDLKDVNVELFNTPSLEVVKKRQIINSDDSLPWSKISTALIAIIMGLMSQAAKLGTSATTGATNATSPFNAVNVPQMIDLLEMFVSALIEAVSFSKQSTRPMIINALVGLKKVLVHGLEKSKAYLERLKYNASNASEITALIKAGSCISGSCK